jgi:predicted ABC-type ATPase
LLRKPPYAVARVAARVRAGGHDVPEADIRRRYARRLRLFEETYKPVVDHWTHYRTGEDGLVFVTDSTA